MWRTWLEIEGPPHGIGRKQPQTAVRRGIVALNGVFPAFFELTNAFAFYVEISCGFRWLSRFLFYVPKYARWRCPREESAQEVECRVGDDPQNSSTE